MLSVLLPSKKRGVYEETFGGDGCAYHDIVMMVSRVYEYAQTHQIIYIKHMKLFLYQCFLNKGIF